MEQPHSEENVRDLLDRREHELLQQIQLLQNEVLALRNDLSPKEVELIEVRRAKAALGMSAGMPWDKAANLPRRSENQPDNREAAYHSLALTLRETPYESMKIKDLLVLAFIERFQQHGASPADLKTEIQTSYGRDIDPGSIRPNLARLREDGVVLRSIPPRWILRPDAANIITPVYFDGDLLRAATALAWREDTNNSDDQPAKVEAVSETKSKPPGLRVAK
jgi:hypothetical protein